MSHPSLFFVANHETGFQKGDALQQAESNADPPKKVAHRKGLRGRQGKGDPLWSAGEEGWGSLGDRRETEGGRVRSYEGQKEKF